MILWQRGSMARGRREEGSLGYRLRLSVWSASLASAGCCGSPGALRSPLTEVSKSATQCAITTAPARRRAGPARAPPRCLYSTGPLCRPDPSGPCAEPLPPIPGSQLLQPGVKREQATTLPLAARTTLRLAVPLSTCTLSAPCMPVAPPPCTLNPRPCTPMQEFFPRGRGTPDVCPKPQLHGRDRCTAGRDSQRRQPWRGLDRIPCGRQQRERGGGGDAERLEGDQGAESRADTMPGNTWV